MEEGFCKEINKFVNFDENFQFKFQQPVKKLSGKRYNFQKIAIRYDNLQKKCDSLQFANMALCLICIILKEIQKSNTFRLCFTCEQGSHIGCRPGPMIKQNELII